jgi:glutamate dehydrogenase (NADP+)
MLLLNTTILLNDSIQYSELEYCNNQYKNATMDRNKFLNQLKKQTPNEDEFHQAVTEVLESIEDVYNENPKFASQKIIERIVMPDRIIMFRVPWMADNDEIHVN